MKIFTVVGARPQFIKAAVLSRAISKISGIEEVIIHTGQHFDFNMSKIFFDEMNIPNPNYNLNINGLEHGAMTGQMLEKIESLLKSENPDILLVYGDTNSTLAGALAASKLKIKIAHIEAGLRSHNMIMPEEINRILTDRISNYLYCPTITSINNLHNEGYQNFDCKIVNSGDVMFDAALFYLEKAKKPIIELPDIYVLCTIHRGENTDNIIVLKNIMNALEQIAEDIDIVIPIHPRTKNILKQNGYNFSKKIYFIEPVSYFEMIYLINNSNLIITDSGGLQKEAYFFHKRCLVLRNETEWTELVDSGYNLIGGTETSTIVSQYNKILNSKGMTFNTNIYGDGKAGQRIIEDLIFNYNAR